MGTNKFPIKTFESFLNPVVEFKKKVYSSEGIPLSISPGKADPSERGYNSFSIDIHEIEENEEKKTPIRKLTDSISIELFPDWVNKNGFDSHISKMINQGEQVGEILSLAVRLVCPKINFVIESKRIPIISISEKKPIRFRPFNLNDVVGKIEVQSELVRIKSSNQTNPTIAFANLTVLSRNRGITFYIDEVDDIGNNALPLTPGDTKDKMFVMKNLSTLGTEPPTLIYHEQFEDFFNDGDNYQTVKSIMVVIGMSYCEQLLKWIIYGKPDYEKKEHKVIIKFIGEICDRKESDLEKITNEADGNKKTVEYLKLSSTIFENIQYLGKGGWKKTLYEIIQNEKNKHPKS